MDHKTTYPAHRFAVAPMIDWTDRHCRFFHRQMTQHALLYTEMIVADAILHGDQDYLLGYDEAEHPVALQLGGSDPVKLAKAAKIGNQFGYDEINLNVGCPSDRVQSGVFGACLMRDPDNVANLVDAMQQTIGRNVTVKCRIGVDDQDPYEILPLFIAALDRVACKDVIIHARKAWLKGLSPKENRTIPPLDYDIVHQMKAQFPHLKISINGGIRTIDEGLPHLESLDGIMLGRSSYEMPAILMQVDEKIFDVSSQFDPYTARLEVIDKMIAYIDRQLLSNHQNKSAHKNHQFKPHNVTRHMLGLFHGLPGARAWRRDLTVYGPKATDTDFIKRAIPTPDI